MKNRFSIKCIKPEGWYIEHILKEATFSPDDDFFYGPFKTRELARRIQKELKQFFYTVDSITN